MTYDDFQEKIGKYISAPFVYFDVPADYAATTSNYDTTVAGVRLMGFSEAVAELAQYNIPVVEYVPEVPPQVEEVPAA